jgi:fluoride exporter
VTRELRVAVMAGGALGTLLRWVVATLVDIGAFPLATLLVNLIGAFSLAWLAGARSHASDRERAFLGTGLLGSFTTFSAIAVDMVALGGRPLLAGTYAVTTLAGGLAVAHLGLRIGRAAAPHGAAHHVGGA